MLREAADEIRVMELQRRVWPVLHHRPHLLVGHLLCQHDQQAHLLHCSWAVLQGGKRFAAAPAVAVPVATSVVEAPVDFQGNLAERLGWLPSRAWALQRVIFEILTNTWRTLCLVTLISMQHQQVQPGMPSLLQLWGSPERSF